MENLTELPKIEMTLGKIEMDCDGFLELRPGQELCFSRPSEFEATLVLNGESFAKVLVRLADDSIKLKIKELSY